MELGAELAADADTPEALLPSDPPGEGAKGTVKLRRKPRVLLPEHLPKEVTAICCGYITFFMQILVYL